MNIGTLDYRVTVPEMHEDGVQVERFTVSEYDAQMHAIRAGSRAVRPGTYTRLYVDKVLWMSDTPAEWADHYSAVRRMSGASRVLINGLGIGMVLQAALSHAHVQHVDVVELDERIVRLVGSHYTTDPRVTIHHADAYSIQWPVGTRWDVAWHDIWPELCEDNLSGMARLHRKYGGRAAWQGSWSKDFLVAERRRTANEWLKT